MRALVVLAGLALLALLVVPAGSATQARPQGFSCNPGETVCHYSDVEEYGPLDTGLVCGSGAEAFDIFDQAVLTESGTVWFDQNGNLTKLTDKDVYSFGEWSNPITGATVSYTQDNEETFVLAVPGDFTSATDTITGQNIYRAGTGAPVLLSAGKQVFNFDETELLSSHGPNAFVAAFFEGDAHAFDQVCAALAV